MAQRQIVTGVKELVRALKQKGKNYKRGFEVQIKRSALLVLRESKRLVPVDTGTLKSSGFVHVIPISGGGVKTSAIIGYVAHYALMVHEAKMVLKGEKRPGKDHKGKFWSPIGRGQNKFLEQPFRLLRHRILRDLRKAMLLGKGV